jgi:hypothetical protein
MSLIAEEYETILQNNPPFQNSCIQKLIVPTGASGQRNKDVGLLYTQQFENTGGSSPTDHHVRHSQL